MGTLYVNKISSSTGSDLEVEVTVSGSAGMMMGGAANFSNNVAVSGTLTVKGNVTGAADLTVNRISGSERGMTTLGTALFSNSTSIKASGSVSAATTLSGTQALQSAKLTINGVDVATQAGALVAPTTVSGAGSVSGQLMEVT